MTRRLAIVALFLGLLGTGVLAQTKEPTAGAIKGVVFTIDRGGDRSVVPGAKISLDGSTHFEGESDALGQFAFTSVPPGNHTLTANAPGLSATRAVAVIAGSVSAVSLEMKLVAVADSTTVTASTDHVDTKESSGSTTVGESTVEHMPNRDEHFENLLPLVPGVVRGPSGRINMKGARPSENGSLVNSADVTDPVTGENAINIPIDVVSDPKIGKYFVGMGTDTREMFKQKNKNLVCNVTGGPCKVISRPAKTVHAGSGSPTPNSTLLLATSRRPLTSTRCQQLSIRS
jgi:hypothetical protein